MMYTPTAKGYFSGCGGMELGMIQAGINVIQSLDLDPKQPPSDIILGTYPCTKYFTIADIHGTRTGDDLFLHFFRHIAIEGPELYIVENVPGMKKFKVVMEAMTELPGYYINIFCPLNASIWLPQRRKRLILIGTKKRFPISQPLPANNSIRLRDILEKNPEVDMPTYVLSRIKGKYRDRPIVVDPGQPGAIAPTCVAHYAKDLGTRLVKDSEAKHGVRPFSIREYARLQGFPDDFQFEMKRSAYKLIGNAVPVHMAYWVGEMALKYFN